MSIRRAHLLLALLVASNAACYRYVTTTTPMSAADCPAEPPSKTFARYWSDSVPGRGILRGTVVSADEADSTRRRVMGATVAIERLNRGAYTDEAGRFIIPRLAPGRYLVVTRRVGFEVRRDSVVVDGPNETVLDVGLKMAVLDGCPGFAAIVGRKRVWRWPWQ